MSAARPTNPRSVWLELGLITAQLLFGAACGLAHPDLIEQIAKVSDEMGRAGETPERLQQRAELFRRHAQFDAALADIATAERLQTNAPPLTLERARILCDAGRSNEALAAVQEVLARTANQVEALIIRAKCRAKLGDKDAAIADFNAAIASSDRPAPDWFLQRARLLAESGKLAEASRSLDEIASNTPFASPAQLTAINYDRRRGAFDSALARVDTLIRFYPVKEPWRTLQAEILEQAGRREAARTAFRDVITGIESYPATRRKLELTKQLEERARAGLARTADSSGLAK